MKPARLGSSVGITKVATAEQLDAAVEVAARHDPKVIVEANAPGKEVECSMLGHSELIASVPGEIVAHADWYDYEAKYAEGGMDLRVPAEICEAATERVQELARRMFRLCGCCGPRPLRLLRSEGGDGEEVLVNELNTIPGFTETSVYGKLLEASGIPYAELCDRLVQLAIERHATFAATSSDRPQLKHADVADLHLVAAGLLAALGRLRDPDQEGAWPGPSRAARSRGCRRR